MSAGPDAGCRDCRKHHVLRTTRCQTTTNAIALCPSVLHVRWFVLKEAVDASKEQIGKFAARYPHNARPTQPLNARNIEQTRD